VEDAPLLAAIEEAPVHETAADLERLQDLLDRSYLAAGEHLLSIHTPNRRLSAPQLVDRLYGMRLLVLATVGSNGRPYAGPVDGIFHRGSFYFGTDSQAVRWLQIQHNPAVSATHLPSEDWAVVVHGRAVSVDTGPGDADGLRATLLEVYTPRYGEDWARFLDSGPVYARIDADRMFAIDVTAGRASPSTADQP
jgi:nitroimidazol reductase NimA-like FMN-containing flavoprotein (pyridoxamine 5'-phosphate oxidase superfamily)